jgi:hypothetical protein
VLLPAAHNIRKVGGRGVKAFWVFDANYDWHWDAGEAQPRPTNDFEDVPYGKWRLELGPAGTVLDHNFLAVLHHAIAAFPQWEFWSGLVGIPHEGRTFTFDQVLDAIAFGETLHIEIADPEHPISRGLSAWDTYGETWGLFDGPPDPECHTLVTTDHPKMRMRAMAWTHQFRSARGFCLQPGHSSWVVGGGGVLVGRGAGF